MKNIIILLLISVSNLSFAAGFPQNIEKEAVELLESELSHMVDLASFEIDKVNFVDMDSHAEYYLQGSWKQVLLNGTTQECTSEIYYSRAVNNIVQFSILSKTCF